MVDVVVVDVVVVDVVVVDEVTTSSTVSSDSSLSTRPSATTIPRNNARKISSRNLILYPKATNRPNLRRIGFVWLHIFK